MVEVWVVWEEVAQVELATQWTLLNHRFVYIHITSHHSVCLLLSSESDAAISAHVQMYEIAVHSNS
jgi:hypothetical protein